MNLIRKKGMINVRHNITNGLIIETATKIADEQGLDAVSLTAIAKQLDIKKQSLYNHIDSLQQVRRDLVVYADGQLQNILADAAIGKSREQAVFAVAEAYRCFAHKHPGQYRAIMADTWKFQKDDIIKASTHTLMEVLRKVLSQYNLTNDELTHAARGFRSVMHGFVSLEASGWFHRPLNKTNSYVLLIRTFIYGVETLEKKEAAGKGDI